MAPGYHDILYTQMISSTATLLLQIVFILVLCRILGRLLALMKQPPVVGEIIAGILMGPSVLGQIPQFKAFMWPPQYQIVIKGLSDLGIVFFMFVLGLEFNAVEIVKSVRKTWMIGAASIMLPFSLGASISWYLYDATNMVHTNPHTPYVAFLLFTGSAMSFTAFPVLARILTANNALTAQIGLVSMGVTSLDDALAWTVLAIATSYQTGGSPRDGAWGILICIGWVIFLLTAGRKALIYLRAKTNETNFIVITFVGMLLSAWFTQVLGLHAFFGGFIFGVSVPKHDRAWNAQFIHELEVVVVNFFVPIFFANAGLGADFSQLRGAVGPIFLVLFCAVAGKMVPPLLLGRFFRKYSWSFSFQLASLMNARGLVELIALSIAKDSGAFNLVMYSVFVIMALTTTFMSGPMFYFAYDPKKDPPAAARISHLANANPQEPVEPQVVLEQAGPCVEIPKDEQLGPALVPSFSGYLYTGNPLPHVETPYDPVSSTAVSQDGGMHKMDDGMQKMEDGISSEPIPRPSHNNGADEP